jgi:hypothetical protein
MRAREKTTCALNNLMIGVAQLSLHSYQVEANVEIQRSEKGKDAEIISKFLL